MSGEVNYKLYHPRNTSVDELQRITPNELFSANYAGKPVVAMILSGSQVLVISGSFSVRTAGWSHFFQHGTFIDYLSTDDSVQLFGSQDPKCQPPTDELEIPPSAKLSDPRNFFEIPVGVPFVFTWEYTGNREFFGIKLHSSIDKDRYIFLRYAVNPSDGGDVYGNWTVIKISNRPDDTRRFIRYEPVIPETLRNHPNQDNAIWET